MPSRHVVALDGVRGVAAAMVFYWHLFPDEPVHRFVNWGYIGVRLFFVLSGYLITGILLDTRADKPRAASHTPGRWHTLRAFYLRRALRIFPIYFVVLAIAYALDLPYVRSCLAWYVGYLVNWLIIFRAQEGVGAGHLWSLAVEEEFYLLWPWLMLLVPRRHLLKIIVAFIAGAVFTRLAVTLAHGSAITITFNTPGCFDTLGAGALLAYVERRPIGSFDARRLVRWAPLVAIPLLILAPPFKCWRTHYVAVFALQDLFFAAIFVAWIGRLVTAERGVLVQVLRWGPLTYFGKVSYGAYLYHPLMESFLAIVCVRLGWPSPRGYERTAILVTSSIAIAALSWHFFEAPINRLKRYFAYAPAANAGAPLSAPAAPAKP